MKHFVFTEENRKKMEIILKKYPEERKQSAVMPLLMMAQQQNRNYLSTEAMDYVAEILDMPPIHVYEVATFYTMYNLQPVGENHVQVCTNISCWLRGSDAVMACLHKELGIKTGETTDDGLFTLSEVECLGACANAVLVQVNETYHEDMTPESTKILMDTLKKRENMPMNKAKGRKAPAPTTIASKGD